MEKVSSSTDLLKQKRGGNSRKTDARSLCGLCLITT
jgi:hypothetical protein